MVLEAMSKGWTDTLRRHLKEQKTAGLDPVSALRAAEILCGKANEEFTSGGKELVEAVYNGTFAQGREGLTFTENPPEAEAAIAPPPVIPPKKKTAKAVDK